MRVLLPVPVDRRPGFVAAAVRLHVGFDLRSFLARLDNVPADPEDNPQDDHQHFPSLEGIDCADILEIYGPARHSIGGHVSLSSRISIWSSPSRSSPSRRSPLRG